MFPDNILINRGERRVRAGWRLGSQFLLFMVTATLIFALKEQLISQNYRVLQSFILTVATLLSVYIASRYLDRRPLAGYGLNLTCRWWKELGAGLAFGTLAMATIFGTLWGLGWVEITGYGWERTLPMPYSMWLGGYFLSMILVGFYEELLFRGYQIINLAEGLNNPRFSPVVSAAGAVAISSVIFGLMHAGNPNASWISTLNIILAGAVLALPFLLTGRLAMSVGLHISWNFVQGGLFGLPVSGVQFRGSLLQIQQSGPGFITGGNFGPEAGLLGLAGLTVLMVLIGLHQKKSNGNISLAQIFIQPRPISIKTHEQG